MSIRKQKLSSVFFKYGVFIGLVILCLVLTFITPNFLTAQNILNILRQVSIIGMLAVGMTFVIITGGIDLSVGSILALSAVVATSLAHPDTYPLIVPIVVGLLVGLGCGVINGVVVSRWKVAPFIVTLGMMTAARGLTMVYTNGRPVINLSDKYNFIGGGYVLDIPLPIIIFVGIALIGVFLLNFTKFGRHVYSIGGNESAARLSGVNVGWVQTGVFALSGLFAGLAGIVLSSRVMAGSPVLGQGYELDAIASVVIGGTSLMGGVGKIGGTVIGVLIIGVMNNGLDLMNVSSYYQQIIKGIIIILAVLLDKKKS
ncbi:ABC transporter permease [Cohnella thermotolerans]|uniref:ABC transporter permease n=1 Tax=Cohnella thermotolerans TaxID=329858 RepID=UPI00040A2C29|nr:hypothetical protein [Cohnella thermotolerans]